MRGQLRAGVSVGLRGPERRAGREGLTGFLPLLSSPTYRDLSAIQRKASRVSLVPLDQLVASLKTVKGVKQQVLTALHNINCRASQDQSEGEEEGEEREPRNGWMNMLLDEGGEEEEEEEGGGRQQHPIQGQLPVGVASGSGGGSGGGTTFSHQLPSWSQPLPVTQPSIEWIPIQHRQCTRYDEGHLHSSDSKPRSPLIEGWVPLVASQ